MEWRALLSEAAAEGGEAAAMTAVDSLWVRADRCAHEAGRRRVVAQLVHLFPQRFEPLALADIARGAPTDLPALREHFDAVAKAEARRRAARLPIEI